MNSTMCPVCKLYVAINDSCGHPTGRAMQWIGNQRWHLSCYHKSALNEKLSDVKLEINLKEDNEEEGI